MHIIDQIYFFQKSTSTGESTKSIYNPNLGSQLIVQVSGSATNFELCIKGAVDKLTPTTELGAINMSTFSVSKNITAFGIYSISVDGLYNISAEIKSITGGNLTVSAKIGF